MTLKVIGAGFGRTGTLSLKSALDELGLGPCYHMVETRAHPEHDTMWLALAKGEASDWRPMLKGYASTVDWPTTYFWKQLAAANPDAKIILTLRDPEAWYRSAAATIFARMLEFEALRADPDALSMKRAAGTWRWSIPSSWRRPSAARSTRTHAIQVFNAHNEDVRRSVPRERLLVYESGEGWEPLCDFLGLPVPATPYPKVNTTATSCPASLASGDATRPRPIEALTGAMRA